MLIFVSVSVQQTKLNSTTFEIQLASSEFQVPIQFANWISPTQMQSSREKRRMHLAWPMTDRQTDWVVEYFEYRIKKEIVSK